MESGGVEPRIKTPILMPVQTLESSMSDTILSGDLNSDDGPDFLNNGENSYHVVTGSGTDPTAIFDGMTITAGNANGDFPENCGGGMLNINGDPTVKVKG